MEYHQDQWANIVTWGLLQIWWCRQTDRQSYSIIRINQQKYTYIGFGEEMMFYTCPDKKGKSIERKNHLLHKRINIEEKIRGSFYPISQIEMAGAKTNPQTVQKYVDFFGNMSYLWNSATAGKSTFPGQQSSKQKLSTVSLVCTLTSSQENCVCKPLCCILMTISSEMRSLHFKTHVIFQRNS